MVLYHTGNIKTFAQLHSARDPGKLHEGRDTIQWYSLMCPFTVSGTKLALNKYVLSENTVPFAKHTLDASFFLVRNYSAH